MEDFVGECDGGGGELGGGLAQGQAQVLPRKPPRHRGTARFIMIYRFPGHMDTVKR